MPPVETMDMRAIFRSKGVTNRSAKSVGETGWRCACGGLPIKRQGKNPHMVTIQLQNLIDFVADVFAHADSSREESRRIATYLTTANLTGHDSHGVIRVPVYIRWKKMGSVVPDQTAELVVDTPSLAVVDGKFGYGQTVTPQAVRIGIEKCKKAGPCCRRAAQRRAYRPRRRLGGNGGGRGTGLGALRQRRRLALGRALRRRREAVVDRALLRRDSAQGAGSDRARFRHFDRRRRQGAGRKPRRQEIAQGRADRCRRHV